MITINKDPVEKVFVPFSIRIETKDDADLLYEALNTLLSKKLFRERYGDYEWLGADFVCGDTRRLVLERLRDGIGSSI